MMILRSAPASPFGRKVKIAASLLSLSNQIEIVAADTAKPDEKLLAQNPLGKIPVLELSDGTTLFDSRVIVEYLDSLSPGQTVFPAGMARFAALRLAALADGIMEAALLLVYEKRLRPESAWNAVWMENQTGKIARALTVLSADPPAAPEAPMIGEIGLACALGYLDLRHQGVWRTEFPALVPWLDRFAAAVPAFEATRVKT